MREGEEPGPLYHDSIYIFSYEKYLSISRKYKTLMVKVIFQYATFFLYVIVRFNVNRILCLCFSLILAGDP